MNIYIYIFIYIYMCVYMYLYLFIHSKIRMVLYFSLLMEQHKNYQKFFFFIGLKCYNISIFSILNLFL